jgi:hypothetical protein
MEAPNAANIYRFSTGRGDLLDLVALMDCCSVHEAGCKLQSFVPISPALRRKAEGVCIETGNAKRSRKNGRLSFALGHIDSSHPYLQKRGITIETAQFFGVGFFGAEE